MAYEQIPEEWIDFTEEEERELTTAERLRWYGLRLVAVIALAGLLYISGIYQSIVFHRTPVRVQETLPATVEAQNIDVSLRVVVFGSAGSLGSERDEGNVRQLVENASALWKQASITLATDEIVFAQVDDSDIESFVEYPVALTNIFVDQSFSGIHVFLLEGLSGLNGISFTGSRTVAVADFTTVLDYRTLAHEIGHILHLSHTADRNDLLYSGTNGMNLSIEEISTARDRATALRANI